MSRDPNAIVVRIENDLVMFMLDEDGSVIDPGIVFDTTDNYYRESVNENQIVFILYDEEGRSSSEAFRITVIHETGETKVIDAMKAGALPSIVEHAFVEVKNQPPRTLH